MVDRPVISTYARSVRLRPASGRDSGRTLLVSRTAHRNRPTTGPRRAPIGVAELRRLVGRRPWCSSGSAPSLQSRCTPLRSTRWLPPAEPPEAATIWVAEVCRRAPLPVLLDRDGMFGMARRLGTEFRRVHDRAEDGPVRGRRRLCCVGLTGSVQVRLGWITQPGA